MAMPIDEAMATDLSRKDMDGRTYNKEVRNAGSEHWSVSSECEAEDGNYEDNAEPDDNNNAQSDINEAK
jgi:hypothetical protein